MPTRSITSAHGRRRVLGARPHPSDRGLPEPRVSRSATSRRCSATRRRSVGRSTTWSTRFHDVRRRPCRRGRVARVHPRRAGRVPPRAPGSCRSARPGKLPWAVAREEYELEYGTDKLEIHRDAIHPGERILIVDDVLATGGTAAATGRLVETLGGVIVGLGFLLELADLGGRERLGEHRVESLTALLRTPMATVDRVLPWRRHHETAAADRADAAARALPGAPPEGACRHDQPRLPHGRRGAPVADAVERRELHQPPARGRQDRRRHRPRRDLGRRGAAARRRRGHRDHARRRRASTSAPRSPGSSTASPSSSGSGSTRARPSRRPRCARCSSRWPRTSGCWSSSSPTGCTTCARSPACRPRSSSAIAQETLDIYAPLAHRLGMQEIKQQLEDLSFAALHPKRYAELDHLVAHPYPRA